jgi:DNA-binding transcriptional regulator YdaS (Cro superfamily)
MQNHIPAIVRFCQAQEPQLSLAAFGRLFDPPLNRSTVMRWQRDGVPVGRVLEVERITGISRHELRPDAFGAAPQTILAPAEAAR